MFLPFTCAPTHFDPKPVCMENAKSRTVAPLGSLCKSPLGVKTKTSLSYKFNLNSSIKSTAFNSGFSSISRIFFNHSSMPDSLLIPLYFQCAASPFSATSSIRTVRICTSTHLPSGPNTVVCKLSYPFVLGIESQSRKRFGLGWYISATME